MRGLACSAEKEEYGEYRMVKRFWDDGGALPGGHPHPRSHNKKRVWNDMWSPALRTLTQTRHLGARSGAWNDVRSAAWCAKWKEAVPRPYTGRLPRSPISEREAGFGTTWRALRGGRSGKRQSYDLARVVYPDPPPMRGGFWNDMRSTWWTQWLEAELRPYAGRLPRTPYRSEKRGLERPGALTRIYPTSEPYAGR